MKLLDRIEKHLKDNHISATRFGRRAVGDPRFVLDLRMGRRPRRRTIERLNAYLNMSDSKQPSIGHKHCEENPGYPHDQSDRS
ncbi:hypothetical protein INR77_04455 [Erythrobacter sp. SCSIO 43205]|uniref:hypothetical protein n=1 Tax=Erythrobacter sp. SCSIO 43205 TaxID=2779361 RepID=UPI001CA86413|nr:hypothetical protein [Erythrobacter sp. SCSIO 43205]UAB79874.1 hypothetical protein INR77_04455 [Erythrobacter sp. SCSIO 43205]